MEFERPKGRKTWSIITYELCNIVTMIITLLRRIDLATTLVLIYTKTALKWSVSREMRRSPEVEKMTNSKDFLD